MHSRSSRMMLQPHWSCEVIAWMWIDWLDLPKLTTLRTRNSGWNSRTFEYPHHITLESDSHPQWMMFRHAQSHQCVSSICIRLQERRHNQRKYSLHPSLTHRHRSSCKSQVSEIEARDPSLCATQPSTPPSIHLRAPSAALERALSLCEHGINDDPHLKWWKSNQNCGKHK